VKIRFEATIENIIAFNRFHYAHSPTWRRQVVTQMLVLPVIFGSGLLLAYSGLRPIPDGDLWAFGVFGIPFVVLSILWACYIRWYMYWSLERNVRKFFAEGSNRSMLGWREMELVGDRLVSKTELIYSSIDLRAIEKIVANDQYTFVYIASVNAITIPMNLYPEDEYRAFVAELREAWNHRGLSVPPEVAEAPEQSTENRLMKRRDY
jgi:hypothetical protein